MQGWLQGHEIRAAQPEHVLVTPWRRAEKVLAQDGAARTHLGYEVLVTRKVDELLEQGFMPADVRDNGGHGEGASM
jgi:hypothetical protein